MHVSQKELLFQFSGPVGLSRNASVLSSDHPEANDCIQAALAQTTFSLNGQCTAVILVGDEEAAAAAAATLLSATAP